MSKLAVPTSLLLMSTLFIGSSNALAQTVSKTQPLDPNAKVCETIASAGTRLGKKVCATRAEWAERKRQDREAVEQAQRSATFACTVAPSTTDGRGPGC
jgi:hypothetical protein